VLQVRLLVAKDGQAFTNMLKSQKDFGNPELLDKVRGRHDPCNVIDMKQKMTR
jgi:hypothetical protein